jgi:TetR/AcrR family transcriptional regulator, tetracycline repressor protein
MIRRVPLTPTSVLDAAVALLDETGLDGFSTRKLATRLDVRVGALYWHHPSRRALLDAAADRIVGEANAAPVPEADWPEQAAAMVHALRGAMLAHADGARLLAEQHTPGPNSHVYIDRLRGLLSDAGMAVALAERAADVLTCYLTGHVIEEQAHTAHERAEADRRFGAGLDLVLAGLRTIPRGDPAR